MTAHQAIKELKQVRQYCTASASPPSDYAIQVLQAWPSVRRRWRRGKSTSQRPRPGANA